MSENDNSAGETAQDAPKERKTWGRPFNSETAKKAAISAARAKRLRKEARHNILSKLTSELDLGTEVLKALKAHDDAYLQVRTRRGSNQGVDRGSRPS